MFDKKLIVEKLIEEISKEIKSLKTSYEKALETSIEAPNRNQSRYDTMGIESAWVAGAIADKIAEKETMINKLKYYILKENLPTVCEGTIVSLKSEDSGEKKYYFILPVAGGYSINVDEGKIFTISIQAPLARQLIGKSIGDIVESNGGNKGVNFIIEEII